MPGQALPQPSCSTTRRSLPRRGCADPLLQSSPATSVLQYELHPWRRPRSMGSDNFGNRFSKGTGQFRPHKYFGKYHKS